jgi:AcrR family transcriptional regulator
MALEKQKRKRKNLSGEERRELIMEAASELFSRHGFCATSMRKLARLAGVTEAVIYQHFPSKEALYEATLERRMDENRRVFLPDSIALATQEGSSLETIISNYLNTQNLDSSFLRMLLFSALEDHELVQDFVTGPMQEFFDAFDSYLKERELNGAEKSMNKELASRLIVGMGFSFALLREVFKDPKIQDVPHEDVVKAITDLICNGMGRSKVCASSAASRTSCSTARH